MLILTMILLFPSILFADNGTIWGYVIGDNCTGIMINISEKQCTDYEPIKLPVQTGDDCRYQISGLKDEVYKVHPEHDILIFTPDYILIKIKDGETKTIYEHKK